MCAFEVVKMIGRMMTQDGSGEKDDAGDSEIPRCRLSILRAHNTENHMRRYVNNNN